MRLPDEYSLYPFSIRLKTSLINVAGTIANTVEININKPPTE